MWVFPNDGTAHAETDAERREAVTDLGVLPECPRQVDHEPHPRASERVPEGDRTTVRIEPRIVGSQPEMITECQYLDREGLIDLECADVGDRQPCFGQRLLGRGNRADAHELGIDASKGV